MKKYKNKRKIIKKYNKDKFYKKGWREPRFSVKILVGDPQIFMEDPKIFIGDPKIFIRDPNIFIKNPIFSWKLQDFF